MASVATGTLADFLLARITEEEELAKAAIRTGEAGWRAESYKVVGVESGAFEVAEANTVTAQHIALHDPARVLAECDAKRRIVRLGTAPYLYSDMAKTVHGVSVAPILRALALPYADHPDFREEWKP